MATLFCCPATGPVEKTAITCRHLSSLGSRIGILDKGPRRLEKLGRKQHQSPERNPIHIHALSEQPPGNVIRTAGRKGIDHAAIVGKPAVLVSNVHDG